MDTDPPYPAMYLMCTVCRAPGGVPCWVRSGRIVDGRPDNAGTTLPAPHTRRKVSARWKPNA